MAIILERNLLLSICKDFLARHNILNQINNMLHEFSKGELDTGNKLARFLLESGEPRVE